MPGLEKLLRGILRYHQGTKQEMVHQLNSFKANPKAVAMYFSCMDCRLQPSLITDTRPGDMFVVRNPGNLIPHARHCNLQESVTGEPAALELTCVKLEIRDVIVCGHSDCKAMEGLHNFKGQCSHDEGSPLGNWLKKYGGDSLEKFSQLTAENNYRGPLKFEGAAKKFDFEAFIDPQKKLSECDKLSQVNCLQQLTNISSYPFMKEKIIMNKVHLHAFWFDIHTGDVFMFSRPRKQFLEINEDTYDSLVSETQTASPA
ncbi:beta carbonic anhydrase 1-like [Liolophura sinensis]|uniref:beta carbonic anhydrase 1-like n=1 Tax=Liolophura sinensis TaxID=3198878 RepID=UPI0031598CF7